MDGGVTYKLSAFFGMTLLELRGDRPRSAANSFHRQFSLRRNNIPMVSQPSTVGPLAATASGTVLRAREFQGTPS
jgi:hypothetical protein